MNASARSSRRKIASYQEVRFYWDRFARELSRVNTYEEAVDYLYAIRGRSHAFNRFMTNFAVFIYTLSVPDDVSWEEVQIYLRLVRRWKLYSSTLFPPGMLEQKEEFLLQLNAPKSTEREWLWTS